MNVNLVLAASLLGGYVTELYLDIQDVSGAVYRGYDRITVLDYSGDRYPDLPRRGTKTGVLTKLIKTGTVHRCWHVDLHEHSAVLEQLLWSGWREPLVCSGEYSGQMLSAATVRDLPRGRGCTPLTSVEQGLAGFDSIWTGQEPEAIPLNPWDTWEPPHWAETSVRLWKYRMWRLTQYRGLAWEQVQLRLGYMRSVIHSIPA